MPENLGLVCLASFQQVVTTTDPSWHTDLNFSLPTQLSWSKWTTKNSGVAQLSSTLFWIENMEGVPKTLIIVEKIMSNTFLLLWCWKMSTRLIYLASVAVLRELFICQMRVGTVCIELICKIIHPLLLDRDD